ncbi:uncharacterized protein [Porites lutea]|uniref:uncharacterized protein isoform X2 n=1 Tax=Porites lutea TaxID=51062 RepID=UPI003CC61BCB
MAAATTGNLFGGGSTGFTFGSGNTTTAFGAPTPGTSTSGTGTFRTSGFSAIKPFGAVTTASTLSTPFGQSASSAAGTASAFTLGGLGSTAGTSFSGLSAPKTTSSAPTLGIFGQTTQAGQSTGFTLGAAPGSSTSTGFSLGVGGLLKSTSTTTTTTSLLGSTSTATTGFGLGTSSGLTAFGALGASKTTAATSTTASTILTGLGGTGTGATAGVVGGVAGKQGDVKDTPLPNPLNEIVDHIKKYVKEQKDHKDEISRASGSALDKVREETLALRQALALVSNSIQRDGCAVENLKMDVSQELKNSEIAQRTNDIPPALQHENTAPQEYFQRLVETFEERMLMYRKQIEIMESHMASLSQGQTLTPQDLSDVMHKLHETFIALAAQLHEIHEAVKVQKEQYLNYRRAYFKDTTDVFSSVLKDLSKTSAEFSLGPNPFRVLSNNSASASSTATNISGIGSFQTNPAGLTGSLGTAGTASLGNPFGTTTGLGSTSLTSGSTFGTPLGTNTLGATGLGATTRFGTPSLTGGFGTPALGSSTGGAFASTGTGFGGTGFGTGTSAFTAQPKFQLQRPPAGNK